MAKKTSMPDFTFALGADLREAAAKMRKMSQPPKHQSAQEFDVPADAMSDDVEETSAESAIQESSVAETPGSAAEPLSDRTSDASPADLPNEEPSTLQEHEEEALPADADISMAENSQRPEESGISERNQQHSSARPEQPSVVAESHSEIENEIQEEVVEEAPCEPLSASISGKGIKLPQDASPEQPPVSLQDEFYMQEVDAQQASQAQKGIPGGHTPTEPHADIFVTNEFEVASKQSVTVGDGSVQSTAVNDTLCSNTEDRGALSSMTAGNRHQPSIETSSLQTTVDDSTPLKFSFPREEGTLDPHTLDDGARSSVYTHTSYRQPQTVTSYHTQSSAVHKRAQPYKTLSEIPENPFQTASAVPHVPAHIQSETYGYSQELSRTAADTSREIPQSHAPKGLQQKYPATPQSSGVQGVSPSIAAATLQDAHIGGARQILLDALTALRQQSPQVVVNLKRLAPAIGLSYGTVRNTISRLVREGVICTTQVRTGDAHGVCVEFIDDNPLPPVTVNAHSRQSATYQQQPQTVMNPQPMAPPSVPADDACIWNTDAELIAILWPFAADAGFGPAHMAQLRRAYQLQGWEPENVSRCLRYLDWELANGQAGPDHVTSWLRIMQRQGHYPRPEGYVDPEVLRLRQQAEEERELTEARTRFK